MSKNEETLKVLLLLKLDAKHSFERIKYRKPEYLFTLSSKRTREHFKEIFYNRYSECTIDQLIGCSQEVIIELDHYYSLVDNMKWYLNHTEEMPLSIEEQVEKFISKLERSYSTLELYLNAELAGHKDEGLASRDTSINENEFN